MRLGSRVHLPTESGSSLPLEGHSEVFGRPVVALLPLMKGFALTIVPAFREGVKRRGSHLAAANGSTSSGGFEWVAPPYWAQYIRTARFKNSGKKNTVAKAKKATLILTASCSVSKKNSFR